MLLVGAFVLAIGYGMACIAAGMALSRVIGGPMAFAGLAVLHLIVGAIALGLIMRRMKSVQLMQGTKEEVSRSISVLSTRSH
jgi:membrane protein implicated in regulation of membrane protease activity